MPTSGSSMGGAGVGACLVPGLELPSLEPPLDLGAVPVAEMMLDNLKSYTPRCDIKDPCNNINQHILNV